MRSSIAMHSCQPQPRIASRNLWNALSFGHHTFVVLIQTENWMRDCVYSALSVHEASGIEIHQMLKLIFARFCLLCQLSRTNNLFLILYCQRYGKEVQVDTGYSIIYSGTQLIFQRIC
jgi:hypothetical protein